MGEDRDATSTSLEASLSVIQRYQSSVGGPSAYSEGADRDEVLAPFRRRLIVTDTVAVFLTMTVGLLVSARASTWAIDPVVAVYSMPWVIGALWLALLALGGSYDQRIIGLGTEEIKRIGTATVVTFSVVAGVSYLFRADISRAYAFVSLPLGLILIVTLRFIWRGWLYRRRAQASFMFRTVVIGTGTPADELEARLSKDYYAGYLVVSRFGVPDDKPGALDEWLAQLDVLLESTHAKAVALTPSEALSAQVIRQLAWRLEGRATDLLISPGLADVGGPRLSVRPAAGLPLLHLDEAVLSRPQAFSKRLLDVVASVLLVLLLWPVMLACAAAIRLSSGAHVIFRQQRIGRAGVPFTMLKFRTMVDAADQMREELRRERGLVEPMFKINDDPRVTSVGKFLRRWSLDELPQIFNVLGGSMSLVGPRPHPLDDVDRYELEAYRRLSIKPGMTGLWQVEGRSDLDWAEALQLDLYYVETWSLAGDVVLLARTARAVIQGRGAV